MVTVACVYVRGHVKTFSPEYVNRLASMVKRHMDRDYKFVVFTDHPRQIYDKGIEAIGVPPLPVFKNPPHGYPARRIYGWWSKLELFNPAHKLTGRVLYLDLDTLVMQSLGPILDYPAEFALIPHAGHFNGRLGFRVVKRFNSSVMVFDATENMHPLYTDWSTDIVRDLHGDQDWIGQQRPDAQTMPAEWFPRISECDQSVPPKDAKVVICKQPKQTMAKDLYPWVREVWQ